MFISLIEGEGNADGEFAVFFGCCIAGAGFTLLLPEVKGRDPDEILAAEIKAERDARRAAVAQQATLAS